MNIKKKPKHMTKIGGQAIIEGVMMRGPKDIGIAVRKPDGEIATEKNRVENFTTRNKLFRLPFIRGVVALIDSMVIGTKAIMFSAQFFDEDEEDNEKVTIEKSVIKEEKDLESTKEENTEKIIEKEEVKNTEDKKKSKKEDIAIYLTVLFSIGLSILIFMIIPNLIAGLFKTKVTNTIILNLIEGVLRVGIFLGYLFVISKLKDVSRLFEYHGAEHKTIHAYENMEVLTVENVAKYPTLHPRCGTSFLFNVMIISIILFSFFGWPDPIMRLVTRIAMFPVIGGIAYELNRIIGKSESKLAYLISYPGLMIQKYITTKEPDEEQLEVAIIALNLVVLEDKELDKW